jgi:RluA family pseudouridine synthase
LRSDPLLADLYAKESYSKTQPFSRMLVKLKKEIIAFGVAGIDPIGKPSPHLAPAELKAWLDEGRDFTLLDVRNDYEVRVGSFDTAKAIGVDHFRDFPKAIAELPETWKEKPLVMFCTGGIRCEKAGPLMQRQGFEQVHQLHGGILQYFEDCGGTHYHGDCFVFDQRVAVDPQLQESAVEQCYACLQPLSEDDQAAATYIPGESCPYCANSAAESRARDMLRLERQIAAACAKLPGSAPYENRRPLNVPLRLSGQPLLDFLDAFHPHIGREAWAGRIANGHIRFKDQAVDSDRVVVAGESYVHVLPNTVEPDVATDIRILHLDEALMVIDKPAPLPVHPCGRYNLNTLTKLLKQAMPGRHPRPAHRLDANTSGLLALTFSREAASVLQPQFADGSVSKMYRALIHGHPTENELICEARIGDESTDLGARDLSEDGRPARTHFAVLAKLADGTSLVEVQPDGGRTHQIRLHAWELGHPIVGDPCYLPGKQRGDTQTLAINAPPMCLQAADLRFTHPATGQAIHIRAAKPEWWN